MPKTKKNNETKNKETETTNGQITKKLTKKKVVITRKLKSTHEEKFKDDSQISISDFEKYKVPYNYDIVRPKIWEVPNRKRFYDWVLNTFDKYETGNIIKQSKQESRILSVKEGKNKQHINIDQLRLNNIQRLTRDFMQGESPMRGLLLYIGLGVGKTCAAVAISNAIQTKRQAIIISKTSLEDNFRKEILQCGADYMKTQNYWVFKSCETEEELKFASEELGIPKKCIMDNDGAFFIDFTKTKSNYNELSSAMKEKIRIQINHLIEARFTFLHMDNTRLIKKLSDDIFDEKIVIIDEVHNIGNVMVSETSKTGPRLYELLMNAKNPKYIFLSGTPLINRVFEATRLFNVLRGYIPTLIVKFKTTFETTIDYSTIKYMLSNNRFVDQIIINKQNKIIKISKNPDYFITHSTGKGIVYSAKPEDTITLDEFETQITKLLEGKGYKISITRKMETCLPDNKIEFEQLFYNPDLNKLKRVDLIKRRIAGLTSYYEYQDQALYPRLLPINKLQIPMSDYQFGVYERFRHQELEKERGKKKSASDDENKQSSYRLKSRFACSFVFPEEVGSPYDNLKHEKDAEFIEMLGDKDSQFDIDIEDLDDMVGKEKEIERKIKEGFLNVMDKEKAKYLDIKNGSLAKHSPKYLEMVKNIMKSPGKILVYSYFKYLIGLNMFSLVLKQTGKWAEFKIRKVNKIWELDENEEDKGKMKYLFYTGNEDREIREIYRNVYNSLWHLLPASCDKLVKQLKDKNENNLYGDVVKILMTTRTGAEGLDLKEVRQIHITEPYWQPVLIDQVIGRGVRNKSHLTLPEKDRTVEVFIYMATIPPAMVTKISYPDVRLDTYKYPNPALADKKGKVVTSDEYLYDVKSG
jgi:hypothetical protein